MKTSHCLNIENAKKNNITSCMIYCFILSKRVEKGTWVLISNYLQKIADLSCLFDVISGIVRSKSSIITNIGFNSN